MTVRIIMQNEIKIAVIQSNETLITDGQSALDLAASIIYENGCKNMIIPKSVVCEDFFKLSTGIAGEVVQKFVNYGCRVAVIGDFSGYTSKPLHDYIYECNNGRHFFFTATEAEALVKLGG